LFSKEEFLTEQASPEEEEEEEEEEEAVAKSVWRAIGNSLNWKMAGATPPPEGKGQRRRSTLGLGPPIQVL